MSELTDFTFPPTNNVYAFPQLARFGGQLIPGGLTKRELFAAMAMQGMISNADMDGTEEQYAIVAVKAADFLIAALEEK